MKKLIAIFLLFGFAYGQSTVEKQIGAAPSTVSAPPVGATKFFTTSNNGFNRPAFVNSSGFSSNLQPSFMHNRIAMWSAAGNSVTLTQYGHSALSATGTATIANVATTNVHTAQRRVDYLVTAASTTAVAGWRVAANTYYLSNSTAQGGFYFACQFGQATGVSTTTHRMFVGFTAATGAPTDVEPSTLVNMFGVGYDAADANLQFMHNDGTGTATKVDLGTDFAVPTTDRTNFYDLHIYALPNTTTVYYKIRDKATGNEYSGSVNTNIPAVNTLLSPRGWMSVGGTSSVIGISFMNMVIENLN